MKRATPTAALAPPTAAAATAPPATTDVTAEADTNARRGLADTDRGASSPEDSDDGEPSRGKISVGSIGRSLIRPSGYPQVDRAQHPPFVGARTPGEVRSLLVVLRPV